MEKGFFSLVVFLIWLAIGSLPAVAAEGQAEKIRVAISSISTSQVNVWVPLDAGFFKKHGLDVELVYISGAPVGAAALMSGEVAISQGGVTGAINSNLKGAGTYIILGGADRFPYQLVVPASIKQLSDLEGKRFIHTNPEGTQKVMRKYLHGDEKAIKEAYTDIVLKATPKIPYPSKPGIQTLLDFIAKTAPEAANAKPDDFIDVRFVKELEDSGLYARLYR